jgi:hypothetical protein
VGTAYGAALGRSFALRLEYGSVGARRGAPCVQEVRDSLEETYVRCRRKRTTPVWVHQGKAEKSGRYGKRVKEVAVPMVLK